MIYVTIIILILLVLSIINYICIRNSLNSLEDKNTEYSDKIEDIRCKISKIKNTEEKEKEKQEKEKLKQIKDDLHMTKIQIVMKMRNIEIKKNISYVLSLVLCLIFFVCFLIDIKLIYKYSNMPVIQEQIKIYSNEDLKIRNDIFYIIETKLENNNVNIKKVNNAYTYLIMYPELKKDEEIYKLIDSSQKYQDQILQLKLKYANLKRYKTILFLK